MLSSDHVLELAEDFLAFAGAVALHAHHGACPHGFEHHLKLRQQLAGGVARAGAREVADLFDQVAKLIALDRLHQLLFEAGRHVAPVHRLLDQGIEERVERLEQLVDQAIDLGVAGVAHQRLEERPLGFAQGLLGERHGAVLDGQRQVPQQVLDLADGRVGRIVEQPPTRRAQAEVDAEVVEEVLGRERDVVERIAIENFGQRGASDAYCLQVLGAHHRARSRAARLTPAVVGDAGIAHQTLTSGTDGRDPCPVAQALLDGRLGIIRCEASEVGGVQEIDLAVNDAEQVQEVAPARDCQRVAADILQLGRQKAS